MAPVKKSAPAPPSTECPTCKGSGEVSRDIQVGREHRVVGQQSGLCLTCLGSGDATAE